MFRTAITNTLSIILLLINLYRIAKHTSQAGPNVDLVHHLKTATIDLVIEVARAEGMGIAEVEVEVRLDIKNPEKNRLIDLIKAPAQVAAPRLTRQRNLTALSPRQ